MEIAKRLKKDWPAYLFLLPAVLLFSLFEFKPMIEGIAFSFFKIGIRDRVFVGLKNYINMVDDPLFWIALKNTLRFIVMVVPLKVALSLLVALVVSRYTPRIQSLFRGAFYLPAVSAGVVMTSVWAWIFDPMYGLLNRALAFFGIPAFLWLSDPTLARMAVTMVILNWTTGFGVVLYLAALAGVPRQVYEAAALDGAGSWQKFSKITLPLIVPITVFILIVTTIGIFQIWQVIFLLTVGGPAFATTSIVYRIYQLGFESFKFGQASAYATVLLMMTFVVAFLQFKWLNREIEF